MWRCAGRTKLEQRLGQTKYVDPIRVRTPTGNVLSAPECLANNTPHQQRATKCAQEEGYRQEVIYGHSTTTTSKTERTTTPTKQNAH